MRKNILVGESRLTQSK